LNIPSSITPQFATEFSDWFAKQINVENYTELEATLNSLIERFPKTLWLYRKKVHLYTVQRKFFQTAEAWRDFKKAGGQLPAGSPANMSKALKSGFIDINEIKVSIQPDLQVLNDDVRFALASGYYEAPERAGLEALLSEDDCILECGVGAGYMGCVSQKLHPGITYLGIEANPDLKDLIAQNQALNGVSFDVKFAAVGPSSVDVVTFAKNSNFLASRISSVIEDGDVQTEIKQISFNELLKDFKPTLLLMDIEGYEYETLIHSDLAGVKKIVLEIHPQTVSQTALNQLLHHFFSLGFELRFDLGSQLVWCLVRHE